MSQAADLRIVLRGGGVPEDWRDRQWHGGEPPAEIAWDASWHQFDHTIGTARPGPEAQP
jgi:hypothetical protein